MQTSTESLDQPILLPRTKARFAAVQALYQMELSGADVGWVVKEFQNIRFSPPKFNTLDAEDIIADLSDADSSFFSDLVYGVVRRQRDIDPIIHEQLASGWSLVRVDAILRAILRAGVFEFLELTTIPSRVVITEYINIAHSFFIDDEPRVINGMLDKIGRVLRAKEFQ